MKLQQLIEFTHADVMRAGKQHLIVAIIIDNPEIPVFIITDIPPITGDKFYKLIQVSFESRVTDLSCYANDWTDGCIIGDDLFEIEIIDEDQLAELSDLRSVRAVKWKEFVEWTLDYYSSVSYDDDFDDDFDE